MAGARGSPYHATVTQVLLVEDDERISQPLLHMLGREGWAPLHAADGAAALAALAGTTPSLVLLDLSLPDVDGLDLCATIRRDHPTLPIVMLTARAQEVDVVVGLGAGADDYVTKPFRVAELVARIRARLRAAEAAEAAAAGTQAPALSNINTRGCGVLSAAVTFPRPAMFDCPTSRYRWNCSRDGSLTGSSAVVWRGDNNMPSTSNQVRIRISGFLNFSHQTQDAPTDQQNLSPS